MELRKASIRTLLVVAAFLSMMHMTLNLSMVDEAFADEDNSALAPIDVIEMMNAASTSKASDVALEGFDLPKGTLNGTYKGKRRVVVVGRASCLNTQSAVSQIAKIATEDRYKDIQFLVFDCDGDREAFAKAYSSKQSGNIRLCTPMSGSSTDYSSWARLNYNAYLGYTREGSGVTLPWLFVIGEDNSILRATTGPQTVANVIEDGFGGGTVDDSVITAHLTGTYEVGDAQKLLDLVNGEREQAGVSPISWDSALELAARQRAAELAVLFGHDRPDGSSCYSALPSAYRGTCGENIAYGYRTTMWSGQVNSAWKNSSGHYANMINASYKSMGAACFTACDGNHYWVEVFSGKAGDSKKNGSGVSDSTVAVAVKSNILAASLNVSFSGGYYPDGEWVITTRHKNGYTNYSDVCYWTGNIDVTDFNWRSSDNSIVEVVGPQSNKSVMAQGVKPGTAEVVIENKANSSIRFTRIVPVAVSTDRDIRDVIIRVDDQEYTGAAVRPSPFVTLNGWPLTQSQDYEVTYSNNANVGTATVTVTGIGDYFYSKSATFKIKAPTASTNASGSGSSETAVPALTMHRLYNPNSGEHFYTSDEAEYADVVAAGWRDEGLGWTAPASSNTPVFRMYNPNAGEHHYCTDEGERDMLVGAGWAYEGVGWYSDDAKAVPLYRDYNPNAFANNHNYTTSKEEHEWLLSLGWRDEGLAWYGV